MQNTNLSELEFKVEQRHPLGISDNDAQRYEELVFTAYRQKEEAGHLVAVRLVHQTVQELSDEFFSDNNFSPPKPRPYVFYVFTAEKFRRQGIASNLVEFANKYYVSRYGTCLYSGTSNNADAIKLLEKLVCQSKAVECEYLCKKRWRFV